MKVIIFLAILIFIYYQIYIRFPEYLTNQHHLYFGGFVFGVLFLYYMMSFHKPFMYQLFTNLKSADEKPLYDIHSFTYKDNKMNGLKYNLAMRQGWRCLHCQNPILQKDISGYGLHYIKPLMMGGRNEINNLGIKCNVCSTFTPF